MENCEYLFELAPERSNPDISLEVEGYRVEVSRRSVVVHFTNTEGQEESLRSIAERIAKLAAQAVGFSESSRYCSQYKGRTRISEDGKKNTEVHVRGHLRSSGSAEIVVKDARGRIIRDSREEQNLALEDLMYKAERDEPLSRMLDRLANYHADGDHQLKHLFDIIEVAETTYHGDKKVVAELGISGKTLERATKIMHDPSIITSRHPGQFPNAKGPQRLPTDEEINHCLMVVNTIINAHAARIHR